MTKISEISANLRPQNGKFFRRKTLYPEGLEEVVPEEVHAAAQEVEEENLQKVVHGLDQLFIDDEVPIGDDQVPVGETEGSTNDKRLFFCSLKNKLIMKNFCIFRKKI